MDIVEDLFTPKPIDALAALDKVRDRIAKIEPQRVRDAILPVFEQRVKAEFMPLYKKNPHLAMQILDGFWADIEGPIRKFLYRA